MLLWGEDIYLAAPECELACCDFLVDLERNVVDHLAKFTAYLVTVLYEILRAESLDCKRHVHDLCRVTITCCKVHKTSFCNDIDLVSVLKSVSYDVLAGRLCLPILRLTLMRFMMP